MRNDPNEQRQHAGGQKRFEVDLARLMTQLRPDVFLFDGLNAGIQIARAARRQVHSGLVTRLKVAAAGSGERQE